MLSYMNIIKNIRQKEFSPVYLLYGEERYLQEELISLLAAAFLDGESEYGWENYDGRSLNLEQIIERLSEGGLFSSRRLIVVDNPPYLTPVRRNEEKVEGEKESIQSSSEKKHAEMLEEYLKQAFTGGQQGILIFLTRAVDRRRRIFKVLNKYGTVLDCSPLKGEALASWIKNKASKFGKKIERSALEKILASGNHDLHFLSNELNKYASYLDSEEEIITTSVVEELFTGDIQGDVFKLSDAMAEGNLAGAYNIMDLLLRKREKPLLIFFMLVRHYRLLLQTHSLMQDGLPQQEFASTLEIHPFVAGKLREQAVSYNRYVLEEVLMALQEADRQIKTGRIEPERALELILGRIDYIQSASQHGV
ncbi:MAG: DNA polymerase III subunit delta [Bacillota bacterium]